MKKFYIKQMSTETCFDIVSRQMKLFSHVVRKDELDNLVVTGVVEGHTSRGRKMEIYFTFLILIQYSAGPF